MSESTPSVASCAAPAGVGAGRLLPAAMGALPFAVAVVAGPEARVVAANPAWGRLSGAAPPSCTAALGRRLGELFPRAAAAAEAALRGAAAGAAAAPVPLRGLPLAAPAADAATWWDLDLVPHPEEAGALLVTAREASGDVLAGREAEGAREALEATAARLRLAQEAAGIGTWEWDAGADRLAWSPEQFRLHGLDPARDAPPPFARWIEMVHPEDRAALHAAAGDGAGGQWQVEFRLRRADTGEWRWLLSRGRVAERGPDGRPLRLIGVNLDVTERRRETEALREREARLRLAFGAARIFAWDWEIATGRVEWSPGAEAALGLPPGGFGGTVEAFRAMVHPEDLPRVGAALRRALAGEDAEYAAEFRMRRGDGSLRWTSARGLVLRDAAGRPERVVGVDHDVTERRIAAESAVAAAAEVVGLREALEAGRVFAFAWDPATDAVRRSPNCAAILGLPAGRAATEDTGRNFFASVHPEDRARFVATVTGATPEAPAYSVRYRYARPGGGVAWLEETGSARFGPDGRPAGVSGLTRDVTAEAEAEAALRATLAELRAVYDTAPVGLCVLDREMRWTRINARLAEINGLPAEAHLGRTVRELLPGIADAAEALHRRVVEAGEPALGVEITGETPARPGVARTWEEDWVPLRDAETGRVAGVSVVAREVTEERALRAALAAGEARFRTLADAVPSMLFEADAEGGRSWSAESWARYTGLAAGALAGGGWARVVHPEDLAATIPAWEAAARTPGLDYQRRSRLRRRDGAWRWHLVRARPERDPATGRVLRWFGAATDVHDLVQAEAALAESEGRLRRAAEAGRLATFEVDDPGAGGEARASPGFRELYGLPPGARLDLATILSRVHPEDRAAFLAGHARLGAAGGRFSAEFRVVLPDGSVRWLQARGEAEPGAAEPGAAGAMPGRVRGVNLDVTGRRAAEQALRDGEAYLRSVLDASTDCVKVVERDGTLAFMNANGLRLMEIDDFEAIRGRDWAALWPEEGRGPVRAAVAEALAGRATRFEAFCPTGRGTPRWWDVAVSPVRDAAGRVARVVGVSRDVTARREAEAALAESEARLRLVLDNLFAFVGILAPDGTLLEANRAPLEAAGVAIEEVRGLKFWDCPWWARDPAAQARVREAVGRAAARGEPARFDVEIAAARLPGGRMTIDFQLAPLRDAEGRVTHLIPSAVDVTARVRAEAALRESEARFRAVVQDQAELVCRFRADGTILFANRAYAEAFGRAAEALEGSSLFALAPREEHARIRAALAALTPERPSETVEHRVLSPGGAARWMEWTNRLLPPAAGAPGQAPLYQATGRDVTERRRAREALAASEARFRALVEAMPQIAFSAAPDGATDFVNARWTGYSGLDAAASLGGGWAEAVHPEDRPRSLAAWRRAVQTGEAWEVEQRLRAADGGYRWFLTRAAPLREGGGAAGRVLRWFGTATDISDIVAAREAAARHSEELERRVAERTRALSDAAKELAAEMRRREEAQAALLQAQKLEALGQLTGGVAHDFNNLLAAILGGYRLLERRVEDPQARELVRHGRHAAERGAKLIAGLMAFARKEDLRPTVVDPAEVLRGAEDMVCHTAGSRARCRFEPGPGTWPVIVDPVRLETVLLNLAANARDAMPGGGTLTVAVRNARPGEVPPELPAGRDWVLVSVADTGAGMDAETLRRATEPFFTTKPPGKGTGLGLASAHGFAAQSGGALRLRSAPGEGTTAELFLPRAGVTPGAGEAGAAAGPPGDAAAAPPPDRRLHGGATLLVVDDDEGVRPVTAAMLRELGYRVLEAASAEAAEALAHGGGERIDMLVTDVVMGGAPGPVLARRLLAERPGLPLLYITAFAGGAELGDAPVLRKPFTEAALARAVLRGLGRLPGEAAPGSAAAAPAAAGAAQGRDRLIGRLRHPALRRVYIRWLELGGRAAPPAPEAFAGEDGSGEEEGAADHGYLAEALPGEAGDGGAAVGWRVLRAGRALEERLGRRLAGEVLGAAAAGVEDDGAVSRLLGGSLAAAHRRCAEGRSPFYDYARYSLDDGGGGGGGRAVLFERLLLPLSTDGGATVTHLAGLAVFTELAPTGRTDAAGEE